MIILVNSSNKANIIHWLSIQCEMLTRSVLASELYAMVNGFDIRAVLKLTIKSILKQSVPMILYRDLKSLYDCLVKLCITLEKGLMVDIMWLRQSYKRQEIVKIKWFNGDSNPADTITKAKPCHALQELINTNTVSMKASIWVEWDADKD